MTESEFNQYMDSVRDQAYATAMEHILHGDTYDFRLAINGKLNTDFIKAWTDQFTGFKLEAESHKNTSHKYVLSYITTAKMFNSALLYFIIEHSKYYDPDITVPFFKIEITAKSLLDLPINWQFQLCTVCMFNIHLVFKNMKFKCFDMTMLCSAYYNPVMEFQSCEIDKLHIAPGTFLISRYNNRLLKLHKTSVQETNFYYKDEKLTLPGYPRQNNKRFTTWFNALT